jgi:hypothetical protein
MSDEIQGGVNPPSVIIPSPPPVGGASSPVDVASAGLLAALSVGVPQDVSGAYEKYADREAYLGEEI